VLHARKGKSLVKTNFDFSLVADEFDRKKPSYVATINADVRGSNYEVIYPHAANNFIEHLAYVHYVNLNVVKLKKGFEFNSIGIW